MIKTLSLQFAFILISICASGQLKHYISFNTLLHSEFFNKEKDKVQFPDVIIPCLSYKVEKEKLGVEVYTILAPKTYRKLQFPETLSGQMTHLTVLGIGASVHYRAINKRFVKINLLSGLTYNSYRSEILEHWIGNTPPIYEASIKIQSEKVLGLNGGVNINAPIFSGLYSNLNIRYSTFPTAWYNKQNFMVEFGMGYLFTRRRK